MQHETQRNQTPAAIPIGWSLTLPAWAQSPRPARARRHGSSLAAAARALRPHRRRNRAQRRAA